MSKDKSVIPHHQFLRHKFRRDKRIEDDKVAEGAAIFEDMEQARLDALLHGGPDFQGWNSTVDMLDSVVADLRADTIQPVGGIVILFSPAEGERTVEQIPFYAMGMSRVELLGLLTDIIRRLP